MVNHEKVQQLVREHADKTPEEVARLYVDQERADLSENEKQAYTIQVTHQTRFYMAQERGEL